MFPDREIYRGIHNFIKSTPSFRTGEINERGRIILLEEFQVGFNTMLIKLTVKRRDIKRSGGGE